MSETKLFHHPDAGAWVNTPDGNRRRVLLQTPDLMLVEFAFAEGGSGALHSHPHIQTSYVVDGTFEVTVDGATEVLSAGGAYIVPSGLTHGVKAPTAGRLVDAFTPRREDFL